MNIKTFFNEKDLEYKSWNIEHNGEFNLIDNEVVIEGILNTKGEERKAIKKMLSKLDFLNKDINDYLHHLAKGMIVARG